MDTTRTASRVTRFVSLAAAVGFLAACAGASSQTPPSTTSQPRPGTEQAGPVQESPQPSNPDSAGVPTLLDYLGPVSFDPDTVEAQRFDTGRMWTFDAPPADYFADRYGLNVDEAWLTHARMGAIRLASWCSASFVSADGLVLTNHHCGREPVTQVSRPGEDLLNNGFYAETLEEERKAEGVYVDQLVEITDVTDEVHAAVDAAQDDQAKSRARSEKIGEIEERFSRENGRTNQVVELFNGGRYSVYTFKRYDDVRLVMAPELAIGYFGGDPDNFTYPRYNLDVSFFRVYEDGRPLDTSEFFFKWSAEGPERGEPVFVVGNPGSTTRLNTVAQLTYTRDIDNPSVLRLYRDAMGAFRHFLDTHTGIENWEQLNNLYFSLSNSEKATSGQQGGLEDAWMMARKHDWEDDLRSAVMRDSTLQGKYGDPWTEIARIREQMREHGNLSYALSFGGSIRSAILGKASMLDQYRFLLANGVDSSSQQAQTLRDQITSPITRHPDLERRLLAAQLGQLRDWLGPDDDMVRGLLGMRSPDAAAAWLQENTSLADPDRLETLIQGAPGSITGSEDPVLSAMDGVVERILPLQQAMSQLNSRESSERDKLARAVYDVYGTSIPPDATFSLRISDGIVTGYPYNGTVAPEWTTFYGLYDRWASSGGTDPWALPARWQDPPPAFDLDTPVNFVATTDIIGGNSGSPMLNADLEVVGAAFDGNIESLPGEFIFLPERNRTVAVHSAGILEAIEDLYGFIGLAEELRTGGLPDPKR
ncbi:MAG: S46 family peptidase [bacterium]